MCHTLCNNNNSRIPSVWSQELFNWHDLRLKGWTSFAAGSCVSIIYKLSGHWRKEKIKFDNLPSPLSSSIWSWMFQIMIVMTGTWRFLSVCFQNILTNCRKWFVDEFVHICHVLMSQVHFRAEAELIKGAYNAEYGGRLSAVLNIISREGNQKELLQLNNLQAYLYMNTNYFFFLCLHFDFM